MQLMLFTDYSMRTLMYLSVHGGRRCTVKEIYEGFGISCNHVVKVVHNLVRLGYVESMQGKGGGIRLALAPEAVNLRKLITELEPHFNLVECFDKERNNCRILSICGVKTILGEALMSFLKTLEKYVLADALTHPGKFTNLFNITEYGDKYDDNATAR
ncbi:MAG: nsrR [Rickettsiales bacterium]|jgi:Rrf2 family nitric oxide-sensitive transcriptional repressor|nr:nsrR [Rickettsiales bacterium]